MLTALYARVSSQRQEIEETIETQIMAIKDFAQKNNYTIVKEYRDDGWSGTTLVRPALDDLRLDATKGLWDAIIIYDPDRLSRKYAHQELVSDELQARDKPILYVTTPPVKNDGDKLLYGVKGLFAEYERSRIAERFRLGKIKKAREGHVVTSQAPYGYSYIPKQGTTHGYFEPNPTEANTVKKIFNWIGLEGLTIRQVIKKLDELQIKPRQSIRGVWNNSTLVTLLRNETYYGKAHFNRTVGIIPLKPRKLEKYKRNLKSSRKNKPEEECIYIQCKPIITEDLFNKVQLQLKLNFERCVRNKKNEYLLSNLIRCTCGASRTGEGPQHGKHLYYRCSDRVHQFPLPTKCDEKGINARIADKLVWNQIKNLMSNEKLMKVQTERYFNEKNTVNNHTQEIITLQNEINKLIIEEDRYTKAYGQQVITLDQLQSFLRDIRLKKTVLESKLKQYTQEQNQIEIVNPTENQLKSFCEQAKNKLDTIDFDKRRKIVLKVVDNIIGTQKELCITGYLPSTEEDYVKFWSECRDCWSSKCREKHTV